MTVFVDDERAPFGRMILCYMIATSDDELHAMADRVGLVRAQFKRDHYDLSLGKRKQAVAAGALEITWRECGTLIMFRRRFGYVPAVDGDPEIRAAQLSALRAKLAEPARAT